MIFSILEKCDCTSFTGSPHFIEDKDVGLENLIKFRGPYLEKILKLKCERKTEENYERHSLKKLRSNLACLLMSY